MGRRVHRFAWRIRRRRLVLIPTGIQASAAWQTRRSLRPPIASAYRRAAVHIRTTQGTAACQHTQRPRWIGALLHILGIPVLLPELHPIHIRRLCMASALIQNPDRNRTARIHRLPRHTGGGVSDSAGLGGNSALGRHATPSVLRPHAKERIRRHTRTDSAADVAHPADGSVLCGGGRYGRARIGARWRRAGQPAHRRCQRGRRQSAARLVLVGASRRHSGLCDIHPAVQAYAPSRRAHQLLHALA